MTLRGALLIIVASVVVAALVPVSLVVRSQTRDALEQRMREDLERAPVVLEDRWSSIATVRMMHARDLAEMEGLSGAMDAGDLPAATRIMNDGAVGIPEAPVLFDTGFNRLMGETEPPAELLDATRQGEMPVSIVPGDSGLDLVALAPVKRDGAWVGAAGGATPMNDEEAQTLSGLTDTEVVIISMAGDVAGSSLEPERTAAVAPILFEIMSVESVAEVTAPGARYLASSGALPGGVKVFFLRDLDVELSIVPALQRSILLSSVASLFIALIVGGLFALVVTRPVGALAGAADRFRAGDREAPVPSSGIREVETLAGAFRDMRSRLAERMVELETANTELADRQERLAELQSELVQRERRLATGQLVAQLAHEIRNPIASIRNCLEVILRETEGSERTEEFARLAIDELLRMHELTEQMLSMNRPDEDATDTSCATEIAQEVARLLSVGGEDSTVAVVGEPRQAVAIPTEGLKQVLLNLVLNAREASGGGPVEVLVDTEDGRVRIQVADRGPGIDEELLHRIFDPFFTTKAEVQGVGLGLFIAEAIVRRYGGSIRAENRVDGPGARFIVTAPTAEAA